MTNERVQITFDTLTTKMTKQWHDIADSMSANRERIVRGEQERAMLEKNQQYVLSKVKENEQVITQNV